MQMSQKSRTAFTVCAYNYLSKALTLEQSFHQHHPDLDFYIVLLGQRKDLSLLQRNKLKFIFYDDLALPNSQHLAFQFDLVELGTFIKPRCFQKLLLEYEQVLYLDPDILVFSSLQGVYDELNGDSFGLLTPHCCTPVDDGYKPADLDFSRFGTYNLGFLGICRDPRSHGFLGWWNSRLEKYGYYEPQVGMAYDQKWLDLAVSYFPGFKIMRDLGLNIAFWNLHERKISSQNGVWTVNNQTPVKFIHFSSFPEDDISLVARKQNRFPAKSRPDFEVVAAIYLSFLKENNCGLNHEKYFFDYFDSGERIPYVLRRHYGNLRNELKDQNPFLHNSLAYRYALSKKLLCAGEVRRANFKEIHSYKKFHLAFLFLLKVALKTLGPDRYASLMRYLAYISAFNNQKEKLDQS